MVAQPGRLRGGQLPSIANYVHWAIDALEGQMPSVSHFMDLEPLPNLMA